MKKYRDVTEKDIGKVVEISINDNFIISAKLILVGIIDNEFSFLVDTKNPYCSGSFSGYKYARIEVEEEKLYPYEKNEYKKSLDYRDVTEDDLGKMVQFGDDEWWQGGRKLLAILPETQDYRFIAQDPIYAEKSTYWKCARIKKDREEEVEYENMGMVALMLPMHLKDALKFIFDDRLKLVLKEFGIDIEVKESKYEISPHALIIKKIKDKEKDNYKACLENIEKLCILYSHDFNVFSPDFSPNKMSSQILSIVERGLGGIK